MCVGQFMNTVSVGRQKINIPCFKDWVFMSVLIVFGCLPSELKLSQNVSVTETRSFQLDYLVNDSTFPGPEGTVLLHFNVTILPVPIRFTNITYVFGLSRKSTTYAQVLK